MASTMPTASHPKATRQHSCLFSSTNASAALSPTACSTHHRPPNSPPPGLRRLIAKQTNPSNSFCSCWPREIVREKSSDHKLKNLWFQRVDTTTKEASTSLRRRATARSFVPLLARQPTPQNFEVPAP